MSGWADGLPLGAWSVRPGRLVHSDSGLHLLAAVSKDMVRLAYRSASVQFGQSDQTVSLIAADPTGLAHEVLPPSTYWGSAQRGISRRHDRPGGPQSHALHHVAIRAQLGRVGVWTVPSAGHVTRIVTEPAPDPTLADRGGCRNCHESQRFIRCPNTVQACLPDSGSKGRWFESSRPDYRSREPVRVCGLSSALTE
jgi:hypothetical protein